METRAGGKTSLLVPPGVGILRMGPSGPARRRGGAGATVWGRLGPSAAVPPSGRVPGGGSDPPTGGDLAGGDPAGRPIECWAVVWQNSSAEMPGRREYGEFLQRLTPDERAAGVTASVLGPINGGTALQNVVAREVGPFHLDEVRPFLHPHTSWGGPPPS